MEFKSTIFLGVLMISRIAKLLLLGISLFSTTHARVYVTHGFNASHTPWYQPGGDFHDALKIAAAHEGHSVEHFSWQQKYLGFFNSEHIMAGLSLATKIINFCHTYTYNPRYPNDHEIIVVAHSYGGLVSYNASQTLARFLQEMKKEETKKYTGFRGWFKKAWATLAQTWSPSMPRPVISKLCTLGTPHREVDVVPDPRGVLTIYNLFSHADYVAHYASDSQLLPQALRSNHAAAHDIQMLGRTNKILHGFGHSEIHHPTIAANLFDIISEANAAAMQEKSIHYIIDMPVEKQAVIALPATTKKTPAPHQTQEKTKLAPTSATAAA